MSQKYPSLPKSDPIWRLGDEKYDNAGWTYKWIDVSKDSEQESLNKTDTFKMSPGMEQLIKAVVKDMPGKNNIEDGEILEVTDDEMPPLVSYSDTSSSASSDGYSELEDEKNRLEKQLNETKQLLEQSKQSNNKLLADNCQLNNVAASWYQYSYQLQGEINRKEAVIKKKDNKATRLINIIRDKNRELNEIYQKYNTLSKSLDMIRDILNPGEKNKPELNNVFVEYLESILCSLEKNFRENCAFIETDREEADQINKEKFKTFLYNTYAQYIKQVPPQIASLNLDIDNNKKKVMENFLAYVKYIDSMTDSQVDYTDQGWNQSLEDLCDNIVREFYPIKYEGSNGW